MSGSRDKLLYAVISGMFLIMVAMIGAAWSDLRSDVKQVRDVTSRIQREYYKIGSLESEVGRLRGDVRQLTEKVIRLEERLR